MRIGIGLPVTTTGTSGRLVVDWATRAEERGFDSLTTIDRIAYPSLESMTALAAAAAVTSRVLLRTNVLLGPTRDPVMLAKQAATVDQLSDGRFVLGLGVGRRADDYEATGTSFRDRGRRLDAALDRMAAAWGGDTPMAPTTEPGGVPMVFGGALDVALPRILAHGRGWTVAVRPAEDVATLGEQLRQAWRDAGRAGAPDIVAMHYFALGEGSSVQYLYDYYGYQGDRSKAIAEGATRTAPQAADTVAAYRDAGVDEYVFVPAMADLTQVDLLADAVVDVP